MQNTILVSGGQGNLAKELKKSSNNFEIISPSKKEMDIRNYDEINNLIKHYKPKYFIHAGAFTRPMKKHHENPDVSIQTNIIGTSNVVLACMKSNIKLIYISTDYVYPGIDGNYKEEDPLSPFSEENDGISKYGWSKLGGECAVRLLDKYLIIRACLCDFPFPHKAALVDIKKSLIFTKDAAPIIMKLLDCDGIINLGGKSQTVFDFAKSTNKKVLPINRDQIEEVRIAPNTSMDISKLNKILLEKDDL